MNAKPLKLSKTVWFNLVMFVVAIVPAGAALFKVLDPQDALVADAIAVFVTFAGNEALRIFFTKQPIKRS